MFIFHNQLYKEYYLALLETCSLQEQRKKLNSIVESICEQDDPLEEEDVEEEEEEEELQEEKMQGEEEEEIVTTDESFESRSADSDFDLEEEEETMPQKKVKRMSSYSKPVTRRSARMLAEAKSKQQPTKIRIKIPPKNNPPPAKLTEEEAAQILITLKVCLV